MTTILVYCAHRDYGLSRIGEGCIGGGPSWCAVQAGVCGSPAEGITQRIGNGKWENSSRRVANTIGPGHGCGRWCVEYGDGVYHVGDFSRTSVIGNRNTELVWCAATLVTGGCPTEVARYRTQSNIVGPCGRWVGDGRIEDIPRMC